MERHYGVPINFKALMQQKKLPIISIRESVRQHVNLILMTERGGWRFDAEYKCTLWEKDFEQTDNMNSWLDEVRDDIVATIQRYEKHRLRNLNIDIKRDELPDVNKEGKIVRVRNRIKINVRGSIIQTDESFEEEFIMFFGPITII
jgi:phage baseplate assembly protein W